MPLQYSTWQTRTKSHIYYGQSMDGIAKAIEKVWADWVLIYVFVFFSLCCEGEKICLGGESWVFGIKSISGI